MILFGCALMAEAGSTESTDARAEFNRLAQGRLSVWRERTRMVLESRAPEIAAAKDRIAALEAAIARCETEIMEELAKTKPAQRIVASLPRQFFGRPALPCEAKKGELQLELAKWKETLSRLTLEATKLEDIESVFYHAATSAVVAELLEKYLPGLVVHEVEQYAGMYKFFRMRLRNCNRFHRLSDSITFREHDDYQKAIKRALGMVVKLHPVAVPGRDTESNVRFLLQKVATIRADLKNVGKEIETFYIGKSNIKYTSHKYVVGDVVESLGPLAARLMDHSEGDKKLTHLLCIGTVTAESVPEALLRRSDLPSSPVEAYTCILESRLISHFMVSDGGVLNTSADAGRKVKVTEKVKCFAIYIAFRSKGSDDPSAVANSAKKPRIEDWDSQDRD